MAELEPAIPPHLQQDRTIPSKLPVNYQPPYRSYSARFPEVLRDLVMVILGCQHQQNSNGQSQEYKELLTYVEKDELGEASRPCFWEAASVTDNRGCFNEVAVVYWRSRQGYEKWRSESGFDSWWHSLSPDGSCGWFTEAFFPSIERFETVFSNTGNPEGAAHMAESITGPIAEHVYWGSMRDRLPISQTDHLNGVKATIDPQGSTKSQHVKVSGRQNLAIIRSGQDWSDTPPREREKYLETMHPVLIAGMDFLRDHGEEVGCFSCRFMDVVAKDLSRKETNKTFGLAYFDDLASLESWSKGHKTHLNIFGRFIQYGRELERNISLRLFHEVMVLEPEQQQFEYINCHNTTGMLASL